MDPSPFPLRSPSLLLALALVLGAAPACRGAAGSGATGEERPVVGRVERVFDGDSLVVAAGGRREEVRLFGIDAPERTQPWSARARRLAGELALGREVRLERRGTDAYGRTLAVVLLSDGRSLNRELVAAGLAWWYRRYDPDDEVLAALEREAREARRGLWTDPRPVAPWDFRAARRPPNGDSP